MREPSPGTRAMIEHLAAIEREAAGSQSPFLPEHLLRRLESIPPPGDPRKAAVLSAKLGQALLLVGRTEEAVARFQETVRAGRERPGLLRLELLRAVRAQLALAHLRRGEQVNCLAAHNADSCILPMKGGGIHRDPSGSRAAAAVLLEILHEDPSDLGSRWLLNVAHMTLGDYPGGVPAPYLVPPQAFASEAEIPRFLDAAPGLGLAVHGLSGGCVVEDLDGDGDLDVMASSWGLGDQLRVFRNEGAGPFTEATGASGLAGLTGGLNMIHGDYDNDGHPDVLLLRGAWLGAAGRHPSSLLHNLGGLAFDDVTEAAGVLDLKPTQAAAFADADGDGWLDLFVGAESSGATHPCRLYRNRRDGTFEDVAPAAGLALVGFVKGAVWGDYDNDGRTDLYVSRLGGPNWLMRNLGTDASGALRFEDLARAAGVTEPMDSFPTFFFDHDNDGFLDIFVSGYAVDVAALGPQDVAADYLGLPTTAERPRLYRNRGDGTFADVTREAGLHRVLLAMGCNHGDLDSDGFEDIYLGTGAPSYGALVPNRMFRNDGGRRFLDVTTAGGFGNVQKGHAVAFADIDEDGDQDVYEVLGGAYPGDGYPNVLFLNPGATGGSTTIRLEGTRANRSAIGARLRVTVATPAGPRTIHANVDTGGSFGSQSLQQEVGLGDAVSVTSIEVDWPGSGQRQRFVAGTPSGEPLAGAIGGVVSIREGDPAPVVSPRRPLRLAGAPAAAHVHPGP